MTVYLQGGSMTRTIDTTELNWRIPRNTLVAVLFFLDLRGDRIAVFGPPEVSNFLLEQRLDRILWSLKLNELPGPLPILTDQKNISDVVVDEASRYGVQGPGKIILWKKPIPYAIFF